MRATTFLLLCLILLSPQTSAQKRPERVEDPSVKVGDTWIYNRMDGWRGELDYVSLNKVKEVGANGIIMESTDLDGRNPSKIQRTRDFNLVRIEAPRFVQTASPFYPSYAFPLQPGKTWRGIVDLNTTRQPGQTGRADLEGRVVGWESVTVPAGNFTALKIELKGRYLGSSIVDGYSFSGWIEDTLWYAPEVRNAVRYEYKDWVNSNPYNHEIHELMRYWVVP